MNSTSNTHSGAPFSTPPNLAVLVSLMMAFPVHAEFRTEHFDSEPPNWEGVNNRNKFLETKTVEQNFGYSAETNHAGGQKGEAGGRINPAGEPAYYGFKLPTPVNLNTPMTAEGRLFVAKGPGNCRWPRRPDLHHETSTRSPGDRCHVRPLRHLHPVDRREQREGLFR